MKKKTVIIIVIGGLVLLAAHFAVNNYYVALGVNDESLGSVEGEDEYPYLSNVTITAIAAEHCHFLQWSDGNTTNPRMLTVTRDTSLTAYFALDQQFQITVTANDTTMGSVTGSGMYYIGETLTITATANDHYYFSQWSDGVTSNPRVVTVTGDMTYTAVFEPVMYTLTVSANDGNPILPPPEEDKTEPPYIPPAKPSQMPPDDDDLPFIR